MSFCVELCFVLPLVVAAFVVLLVVRIGIDELLHRLMMRFPVWTLVVIGFLIIAAIVGYLGYAFYVVWSVVSPG